VQNRSEKRQRRRERGRGARKATRSECSGRTHDRTSCGRDEGTTVDRIFYGDGEGHMTHAIRVTSLPNSIEPSHSSMSLSSGQLWDSSQRLA
jgi:hypothetical protein